MSRIRGFVPLMAIGLAALAGCVDSGTDAEGTTYTISGDVSGLEGSPLSISLEGGETVEIRANGRFTLPDRLPQGAPYRVIVISPAAPARACEVLNGNGTMREHVANVHIVCGPLSPPEEPDSLAVTHDIKLLRFAWPATARAAFYRLMESRDGGATFAQVDGDIAGTAHDYYAPLHLLFDARYRIDACNAAGCVASSAIDPGNTVADAIGYFKAPEPSVEGQAVGHSVAISGDGDTLAIASFAGSGNFEPDNFAIKPVVRIYNLRDKHWFLTTTLLVPSEQQWSQFGSALDFDHDGITLAVGAHADTESGNTFTGSATQGSGRVYVFHRDSDAWRLQSTIKAPHPEVVSLFGINIDISSDGNTLAIGSPWYDHPSFELPPAHSEYIGGAFIYTRSSGVWAKDAYLKPSLSDARQDCGLGIALSGDGSLAAVGCPDRDWGSSPDGPWPGRVALFGRSLGNWIELLSLASPVPVDAHYDSFGMSLAISADGRTLAASDHEKPGPLNGTGEVYLYRFQETGMQQFTLPAAAPEYGHFGHEMALSADGSLLAVAAPWKTVNGLKMAGEVRLYRVDDAFAWHALDRQLIGTPLVLTEDWWNRNSSHQIFGVAMSMSADGSTLAVSANGDHSTIAGFHPLGNITVDGAGAQHGGAVYLY